MSITGGYVGVATKLDYLSDLMHGLFGKSIVT
jgi:hypothetical protein